MLGFFEGISSETIEDQQRVVPNQGIYRSAFNGLVLGIVTTIIVGLSGAMSYDLSIGVSTELSGGQITSLTMAFIGLCVALGYGLSVGLLVGLLNGGLASLRHYILRFLLWCMGVMPWSYVRFLDEATDCILLRRVGGGYSFVHRLILDYFASLDTPLIKPELPQPSQAVPPRVCSTCGYQEERPGAQFCPRCGSLFA